MLERKISRKLIISIALIALLIMAFSARVFAIENPDLYDPDYKNNLDRQFIKDVEPILGYIQYFGILISVVALAIIGIKYILTSVEGKAEFKKAMLPYVVGCFFIIAISLVLGIIERSAL